MKRRGFSLLSALVLLLALTACGASGGADASGSTSAAEDNNAGWTESAAVPSEGGGTVDFAAVRQNAKLILSADLTLETQSFDQAGADIEALAAGAGGYIEASSVSGELGSRYASYTLRVPQGKFETCFAQLGETCHVVSSSRWSEDVTEQYTDIETRLATLQTKHERLVELLGQAAQMEDIISLENALADCEYEIDSLTGEKRRYDNLVDFATITVSLREVQALTAVSGGTGFGAQLMQAAQSGWRGLAGFVRGAVLWAVAAWPLLLVAGVGGGAALRFRRRRKKGAPPDEPKP